MKIGSIVRARHWKKPLIGVVTEIGKETCMQEDGKETCKVILQDGWEVYQIISDLEVIGEGR